jgi:hypothetical protein
MWHASGLFAPREHLSGFRTQLCRSAEQVFSRLLRFLLGLGKAVSRIPLRSHAAGPQREPSSPLLHARSPPANFQFYHGLLA